VENYGWYFLKDWERRLKTGNLGSWTELGLGITWTLKPTYHGDGAREPYLVSIPTSLFEKNTGFTVPSRRVVTHLLDCARARTQIVTFHTFLSSSTGNYPERHSFPQILAPAAKLEH
jgi:hypothetical protein